jgi:hypothetical protein
MADALLVLEHSVVAEVSPEFAWKFRTDVTTWSDPPATFLLDGPFVEGARGVTLLPGREPLGWWIRDVRPGKSFAIEMPLDGAMLRFEWHLGAVSERRTTLMHRVILSGSNAGAYREEVEAGFGVNLPAGLAKIADSIVAAERAVMTDAS